MASDKEQRDAAAKYSADKMAKSFATAWREGNRLLVKRCFKNAFSEQMATLWQEATAALLTEEEAVEFNAYMEAE